MAPSPVWQYFEKIADGANIKCIICKQIYKFNKNTISLFNHLKSIHKIDLKKVIDEVACAGAIEECTGPLDRSFKSMSAFAVNGHKHKELLNALMFMIVKDGLPLRTPQKQGFRMFCEKLQPLYHPPSVITLTECLNTKYEVLVSKIKNEMLEADSVCLTTDLWKHKHTMQSYLGLTAHYLSETNIKTVELGAYAMDERKSTENLRHKLRDICNEWGLVDEKISAILSDSGANIKGAIRQEFGDSKHISCFGHTTNNIGQRVIEINVPVTASCGVPFLDSSDEDDICDDTDHLSENIKTSPLRQVLSKVKAIVRFFRTSEVATKEFKSLQMQGSDKQYLKLIQEVRTGWNSCYEMVERFILLADHVGRVLLQVRRDKSSRAKPPNMLTGDELEALTEVRDILKPLWHITQEVSAEKNVTLSKCIPLIVGLRMKINDYQPLTQMGKRIKTKLNEEINEKFQNIEAVRIYAAATLLDPRFKKHPFQNNRDAACAMSYLGELVKAEMQKTRRSVEQECEEVAVLNVQAPDPDDIWFFWASLWVTAVNSRVLKMMEEFHYNCETFSYAQ